MRVRIKDKVYSSEEKPMTLIFSDGEINMLRNLDPNAKECHIYPSAEYWTYKTETEYK